MVARNCTARRSETRKANKGVKTPPEKINKPKIKLKALIETAYHQTLT